LENNMAEMNFYRKHLFTLNLTAEIIVQRLNVIEQTYRDEKKRFPVEHYKIRIKDAESAKAKLERLGFPATLEAAKEKLFDLVGIRLICRFFYEVYETVQLIQGMDEVQICQIKDYVKTPKLNGYRSVHMILQIPVQTEGRNFMQFIEIQIRTIAMDFWASLEHELKYKKHIADAKLMSEELKRCADEIISVDLKMQTIYEWLNQSLDADAVRDG